MTVTVKVEGLDALDRLLGQLTMRVSKSVQTDALRQGAEPIRAMASASAPRAPGLPDLADNIHIATVRAGFEGMPAVGIGVSKRFYYDLMQEFGTARHGAQPFYRPAFDAKGMEAINITRRVLWSALIGLGLGSARTGVEGAGLL